MDNSKLYKLVVRDADASYGGAYGSFTKDKNRSKDFVVILQLFEEDFNKDGTIRDEVDIFVADVDGYRRGEHLFFESIDDFSREWLEEYTDFFENPEEYEITQEQYNNETTEWEGRSTDTYDEHFKMY